MKKKLSKVLAVVLSLAMVLGLAAVDTTAVGQAAKKLKFTKTGKKAVKSGQKRTLKISGTKAKKATWTVTGTGKQYIKLAKKKGKTNSFTVKANATGTAKVTAKLTKKNKVSVTYKLSCDLESFDFDAASKTATATTGKTVELKLVANPTNAALPEGVTYAVFTDAELKTPVAADKVTAAAITGGVEFTAAEAGTYYVSATSGETVVSATVTVKDYRAVLKEVKQTKLNELAFTFDSDCSYLTQDMVKDFVVTNNAGVKQPLSKITVDKDDKTKATATLVADLKDGKEATVEYEGAKVPFTATTGEVANITLNVTEAPVNTNVEVKATFTDADGVELKVLKYGETADNYLLEVTPEGEASEDPTNHTIKMGNINDTVKVLAVYDTGKIDSVSNEPIKVTRDFVIKAIAEGKVSTVKEYTIWDAKDGEQKYSDLKDADKNVHEIKVNLNADAKKELYALATDDYGYTKVDGSLTDAGYTLSSSNDEILQVNGDEIQGASEGTAYVLASKDGVVELTILVKVLAAPKLKSFSFVGNSSTLVLSAGNHSTSRSASWEGGSGTFKVVPVDQYGDIYKNVVIKSAPTESYQKSYREKYNTIDTDLDSDDFDVVGEYFPVVATVDGQITVGTYAEKAEAGKGPKCLKEGESHTNYFTITVEDSQFSGNSVSKNVYVKTQQPKYSSLKEVKINVSSEINAALSDKIYPDVRRTNGNNAVATTLKAEIRDTNGVFVAYDYLVATKAAISIQKSGDKTNKGDAYVVNNDSNYTSTNSGSATLGAIYVASDMNTTNPLDPQLSVDFLYRKQTPVTGYSVSVANPTTADKTVVSKLGAGTYIIKVTNIKLDKTRKTTQTSFAGISAYAEGNDNDSVISYGAVNTESISARIKVTDKQAVPTISQVKRTLSSVETPGEVLANAFVVECADTDEANKKYDPTVEDTSKTGLYLFNPVDKYVVKNSNGVTFTKIDVYVPYPVGSKKNDDGSYSAADYVYVKNTITKTFAVKGE